MLDGEADGARRDDGDGAVEAPMPEEKNSWRAAVDRLPLRGTAECPAAANLAKMAGKRSSFVHSSSMLATT